MPGTVTLAAARTGFPAQGTGAFVTPWLTGLASLAVVVALILLSRHALKFLEPYLLKGRRTRSLAVVESLAIDQRRRLSIIRCDRKTGLILTGGGSDVFLGWIDEAEASPPRASSPAPPDVGARDANRGT
ncbi:flagellar biosynthetic protein FliO [Nguyenibacter sp. L1]|uniref:flagellar biosynthetic protein FliO n=1 Tax=Nguyenibacter sp. L1 TaxID=3049350 RepID=UPI002B45C92F|nr:flagellar biosynthetic protein FliO [Nguyenibacter sp. L1]WRH89692.1 flagellar biosynthetic protein FliO [Nguyenibacter sp. L1]